MTHFEQRLVKLEKSVQFYKTLSIIFCSIFGTTILFSFNQKNLPPDVIQTKRLEIVDDAGNVFIKLEKNKEGGVVGVYNNMAKYTFFTSANVKGYGQLFVGNGKGYNNLYVGESNAGGGFLGIKNEFDNYVAEMGNSNSDGGGYVEANDNKGYSRASIYANKTGDGVFEAYNNGNYKITYLGGSTTSTGGVWLYNYYGQLTSRLPN
jgi:hypothetical protein